MKKILYVFVLAFLLAGLRSAEAQTIGLDPFYSYNNKDTVNFNDSISYTFLLRNYSDTAFTASEKIEISYSVLNDSTIVYIDSAYYQLSKNDSLFIQAPVYFTSPALKNGVNVIVIWPRAKNPAITTKDSLYDTVYVLKPNGIQQLDVSQLLSAYPNPTSGPVTIGLNATEAVNAIRIYNSRLQLVEELPYSRYIDLSKYNKGLYLLDINYSNGQHKMIKLIKE